MQSIDDKDAIINIVFALILFFYFIARFLDGIFNADRRRNSGK